MSQKEVLYPPLEELKKNNYNSYCPYLSDYNSKVHKFEHTRPYNKSKQSIFIPPKLKNVVRLGSFNIHNFIGIDPSVTPSRNIDHTLELVKEANLDVIVMQEIVPHDPKKKIIEKKLSEYDELVKLNFDKLKRKMKAIGYPSSYIINSIQGENLFHFGNNSTD